MADPNNEDQAQSLDNDITKVCEKIQTLNKREKEISSATSEIDIVEKDILSRKIRAERRELNKNLSELSVKKALLQNNVTNNNEQDDDDDDDEAEDEENLDAAEAADVGELQISKLHEYNRLNNMCEKTKAEILTRKTATEKLLSEDTSLYTDSEKRNHEIKLKASIKTISEQVSIYKAYVKDVLKICAYGDVNNFHADLASMLDLSNEIHCQYESMKERERKLDVSTTTGLLRNLSIVSS